MTQTDRPNESLPPAATVDVPSTPRAKPAAAPMGVLVWISLIPVILVVLLWVYSGWKEYSKNFGGDKTHGTMVSSDLGLIKVTRWTRTGPSNPMAGETVKTEWDRAGLGYRDSASNDGNSTRKVTSIPFWLVLTIVAILPIITVARAQRRAKRRFEATTLPNA